MSASASGRGLPDSIAVTTRYASCSEPRGTGTARQYRLSAPSTASTSECLHPMSARCLCFGIARFRVAAYGCYTLSHALLQSATGQRGQPTTAAASLANTTTGQQTLPLDLCNGAYQAAAAQRDLSRWTLARSMLQSSRCQHDALLSSYLQSGVDCKDRQRAERLLFTIMRALACTLQ